MYSVLVLACQLSFLQPACFAAVWKRDLTENPWVDAEEIQRAEKIYCSLYCLCCSDSFSCSVFTGQYLLNAWVKHKNLNFQLFDTSRHPFLKSLMHTVDIGWGCKSSSKTLTSFMPTTCQFQISFNVSDTKVIFRLLSTSLKLRRKQVPLLSPHH